MNNKITDIVLKKNQNLWICTEIVFDNLEAVLNKIPRKPGIYQIRTNAPIEALSQIGERSDKKHYNFKKKIAAALKLKVLIVAENIKDGYVVYTGHQAFLKQRCKKHFIGSSGTGCLNIFEFKELRKFNWWFEYLEVSQFNEFEDSILFRTYLEQLHRASIGWPILCSQ